MRNYRAGRFGAARDEQSGFVVPGLHGKRLAIDRAVDPNRREVVHGATLAFREDLSKRGGEFKIGFKELARLIFVAVPHIDTHESLGPTLDIGPFFFWISEQFRGESRRQLRREIVDHFHRARCRDGVEELRDGLAEILLVVRFDRSGRETVRDEAPLLLMARIVLGNHVDFHWLRLGAIRAAARKRL